MDIEIKITCDVPDQDRSNDIVLTLEHVLAYMADNVEITTTADEPEDICKAKAERLVNACNALGLQATLHWDRSPWMCRVALGNYRYFNDSTPSLYVYVEDGDAFRIRPATDPCANDQRGWRWHSQFSHEDYYDINVEILERSWLHQEDEHYVAQQIAKLVGMLDVSGWSQD